MFSYLYRRIGDRWISLVILLIFSLLFFFNILLIERFKIFLFILFFISLWIEIINYLDKNLKENLDKKEDKIYNENIKKFILFIKRQDFYFLLKIYAYNNIILYLITKIEIKLFFWFRRINLFFINYPLISKSIYFIIMGFIIIPIKLVFGIYYKILWQLKENGMIEIFFKRFDGLLISLFFTSYFINFFIYCFKYILILLNFNISYIITYFFIWFYLILLFIVFIFNFIEGLDLKFNFWYSYRTNLNLIFFYRINVGMFSIIVKNLFNYNIKANRKIELNENFIFLINFRIHDMKLEYGCDKESFIYIELKYNLLSVVNSYNRIKYEFKNKPYINLYEYSLLRKISSFNFCDILWGLKKYENNEEIKKQLMLYFIKEEELFKYTIFKLWDIEKYLGYNSNYISSLYLDEENSRFENNFDAGGLDIYKDLINNLKKNKEKFVDLEENFGLFVKIVFKLDGIDESKTESKKVYFKFLEDNKIDYRDLFEYENKDHVMYVNNEKLMPILIEMDKMVKKYRNEWEKEWADNKRSYIWKD